MTTLISDFFELEKNTKSGKLPPYQLTSHQQNFLGLAPSFVCQAGVLDRNFQTSSLFSFMKSDTSRLHFRHSVVGGPSPRYRGVVKNRTRSLFHKRALRSFNFVGNSARQRCEAAAAAELLLGATLVWQARRGGDRKRRSCSGADAG